TTQKKRTNRNRSAPKLVLAFRRAAFMIGLAPGMAFAERRRLRKRGHLAGSRRRVATGSRRSSAAEYELRSGSRSHRKGEECANNATSDPPGIVWADNPGRIDAHDLRIHITNCPDHLEDHRQRHVALLRRAAARVSARLGVRAPDRGCRHHYPDGR